MSTLGVLLEANKKPAQKPSGTKITVTVGQGGNGNQKNNGKSSQGTSKPSSGAKKTQNPEAARTKSLRDLLQHADQLAIFHRQKAAEHGEFEKYHNRDRATKHLGPLHKTARESHESLRRVYHKISNEVYRLTRPEEIANRKEKAKAAKKAKAKKDRTKGKKPVAAKKKKTLKEVFSDKQGF